MDRAEEAKTINEPILIETVNQAAVEPEDLNGLIERFRAEGLDARPAYEDRAGAGPEMWEIAVIWVSLRAGEAIVNQAITFGVEWMKERFRQNPQNKNPKAIHIVRYEGNEGENFEVVEIRSADTEPIRKPPAEFERYTRGKPPER